METTVLAGLLERAGISQAELIIRLNNQGHVVSSAAVSKWCTGRAKPLPHRWPAVRLALELGEDDYRDLTDEWCRSQSEAA